MAKRDRRRVVRRRLGTLAVLALLLFGVFIWVRDLPRRWLEVTLSKQLDARVRIGRLELAFDRVVLGELEVERVRGLPQLVHLQLPSAEIHGRLWHLLRGRVERLVLDAPEIELVVLCGTPLSLPVSGTDLSLDRVELRGGRIDLNTPGSEARVEAEGLLQGGSRPSGHLELSSEVLPLAAVAALWIPELEPQCQSPEAPEWPRIEAERLRLRLDLEPGESAPELRAAADAGALSLIYRGRIRRESRPSLEGTLHLGAQPRLQAELKIPSLQKARLQGTFEGGGFGSFQAALEGVELGSWLPWVGGEGLTLGGRGNLVIGREDDGLFHLDLRAALDDAALRSERLAGVLVAEEGRLELSTRLDSEWNGPLTGQLTFARLNLETEAPRPSSGPKPLDASFAGRVVDRTVEGRLRVALHPAAGRLEVDGRLSASQEIAADWSWHDPDLPVLLGELGFASTWTQIAAPPARARGSVGGPLSDLAIRGALSLGELEWMLGDPASPWTATARDTELDFTLRPRIGDLRSRWRATGELRTGDRPPIPLEGRGQARLTTREGAWQMELRDAVVQAGQLATLSASAQARGHPEVAPLWTWRLGLDEVDLNSWQGWIGRGEEVDFTVGGRGVAELEWSGPADGPWQLSGTAKIDGGSLASRDGGRIVQPLDTGWRFDGIASREGLRVRARGGLGRFQLLWGTTFADFSDRQAELDLDLTAHRMPGEAPLRWQLEGTLLGALASGGLLSLDFRSTDEGAWGYRLKAAVEDLGPVVESELRRPFAAGDAWPGRLRATGSLAAEISGRLSPSIRTARGSLGLQGVGGGIGDSLALEGLDLIVPLELAWSADGELLPTGPPLVGSLSFAAATVGAIELPATSAKLRVQADELRLQAPLVLSILGGRVTLRDLGLTRGLRPDRRLEARVEIDELDLARITEAFSLFSLEGSVSGTFPQVAFTLESLRTVGAGEISLFGGQVEVTDIVGSELLGRFPRLGFSASFDGVDLAEVTRTLEFGVITGRARGYLRDVLLVGGSPVRFRGRLESVPEPGTPQRLSLKAVDNLTRLGTGSRGGFNRGFIPSFLKQYRYERLGFEVSLLRDRFQLRGLEARGKKELFLKGRLPIRLDIVNVRPGSTVSFKTMMSRIGNLEIRRNDAPQDGRQSSDKLISSQPGG